jgi:hypothetical protein
MSEPTAWAVPDSRPEDAAPRVVAAAGPPVPAREEPDGVDAPVSLRPLRTTDLVDGAMGVLKAAPATVVAVAAVAVLPVQLLSALVLDGPASSGRTEWDAALGRPLVSLLADEVADAPRALALLAVESLALSFVAAGTTVLVTAWLAGRRPGTAEVIGAAARRMPTLALVWVLAHLAQAAFGIVLVLPALLPIAWFAVAVPVAVAEGVGAPAALRRSFELSRRAFGRVVGTCLLVAFVDLLLRASLAAAVAAYVEVELPAGRAVLVAAGVLIRFVTVPFVAGAATLLYLDLRVRLEGLDIEVAAEERFPVGP